MEASSAHAKAYLLIGGRFAGATATGTAAFSVLIVAKCLSLYWPCRVLPRFSLALDYCSALERMGACSSSSLTLVC